MSCDSFLLSDSSLVETADEQAICRATVKALQREWRLIQSEEELGLALGEDAHLLETLKKVVGTSFEALKGLSLAWRVREELLQRRLVVFTHAQKSGLGLAALWTQTLADAMGEPLSSKRKLLAPLRPLAGAGDAVDLMEFQEKFGHIPKDPQYDYHPEVANQLLSLSTEFLNLERQESALHFWKTASQAASFDYRTRIIAPSLAELPLQENVRDHIATLVEQQLNQEAVLRRIHDAAIQDLVLVAMPQETFSKVGYLAKPYGHPREGNAPQEFASASAKFPLILNEEDAQVRVVARALEKSPSIESWRMSPLPKGVREDVREKMAWIAAYTLWVQRFPDAPLLTVEEIPEKLCQDRSFLREHLKRQGRFFKYLPPALRKDPELIACAQAGDSYVENYLTPLYQLKKLVFKGDKEGLRQWLESNPSGSWEGEVLKDPFLLNRFIQEVRQEPALFLSLPLSLRKASLGKGRWSSAVERLINSPLAKSRMLLTAFLGRMHN